MESLSPDDVRSLRTHAQHLAVPLPRAELIDAVRAVCGVQAQLTPAMMLALRARVRGLALSDVEEAIARRRRLVRTWAMRGTLHLLADEDVRWIVALLGPIFSAKDRRRRLALGLDEQRSAERLSAIRASLCDSAPLTRHELMEKLAARGIDIERKGQALIHLIAQAALEGSICLGPDRPNGQATYVLLEDAEKGSLPKEAALAQLAHRYLVGYAPADVKDFAAWSGLALTDAKTGWRAFQETGQLDQVQAEGRSLSTLKAASSQPRRSEGVVRLLPAFDAYLLGYADRDYLVRAQHRAEVYHGGQTVPVVLVDGLAAGVWRYDRQGKRLKITVRAFDTFDPLVQRQIAHEADDIGRFFGMPVFLEAQP